MRIELFPLEKIEIDNNEIYLGSNKQKVIDMLGEPETVYEQYGGGTWRHYYYDSELAFDYDINGNLQYIEFLGGHDGKIKPYIYGVSAFDTKMDKLVSILLEHNDGLVDDSESNSYGFLDISVGIWTEDEDDDYWMTIGIGVKDIYSIEE